jgi:hypothetical protein
MHMLEGPTEIESKKLCHESLVGLRESITRSNLTDLNLARVLEMVDSELAACDPKKLYWTFQGATFFWWTVMSTVGYGNFTPQTSEGKAFTATLAVPSIALFVLLITSLSKHITAAADRFLKRMGNRYSTATEEAIDDTNQGKTSKTVSAGDIEKALSALGSAEGKEAKEEKEAGSGGGRVRTQTNADKRRSTSWGESRSNSLSSSVGGENENAPPAEYLTSFVVICALAYIVVCALVGWAMSMNSGEKSLWRHDGKSWNYLECLYFLVITFTTVGLGDYTPADQGSKEAVMRFYALWALALFGLSLLLSVIEAFQLQMGDGTHAAGKEVKKAGKKVKKAGKKVKKAGKHAAKNLARGSVPKLTLLVSNMTPKRSSTKTRGSRDSSTPVAMEADQATPRGGEG